MKILLVGKTGVFDTLVVAYGYLSMDINNCSYFGDLGLDNSKGLVKVGTDQNSSEIFIVGFNIPETVRTINREIQALSGIYNQERIIVIPVSIKGENLTWLLTKLANIPQIGGIFLNWAKNRTRYRSSYLLELGKNLHVLNNLDNKDHEGLVYAAKPHKE